LTRREAEVLDYLSEMAARGEKTPLYREIGEHFGISRDAAEGHLKALRGKGYMTGGPGTFHHLRLSARAKREIAEIGELRARNDQLEAQVKALEEKIVRLERMVGECGE
jgi:DNA-binding MarR family transcriptional regulator